MEDLLKIIKSDYEQEHPTTNTFVLVEVHKKAYKVLGTSLIRDDLWTVHASPPGYRQNVIWVGDEQKKPPHPLPDLCSGVSLRPNGHLCAKCAY